MLQRPKFETILFQYLALFVCDFTKILCKHRNFQEIKTFCITQICKSCEKNSQQIFILLKYCLGNYHEHKSMNDTVLLHSIIKES